MKQIGIKRLFYGEPLTAKPTKATLATLLGSATEITNTHGDTFSYEQDDPEITTYINGLTGKPYHREKVSEGAKTISFTIGEYDLATKAALQGGQVITGDAWEAPTTLDLINKAVFGITKTNGVVIFTNASIVGKTSKQDNVLGLGVAAVAMDNPTSGVADEYWYDYDTIKAVTGMDKYVGSTATPKAQ